MFFQKITAIESDNDNAARRIVMCDRMSGFSHIHITKMFDITVTTANDENTAMYQNSFSILVTTIVAVQRLCICAFPFKARFLFNMKNTVITMVVAFFQTIENMANNRICKLI
jgi:hypothetical protein